MVHRVGLDDHRQVCLPTSETLASAKSPNCLKLASNLDPPTRGAPRSVHLLTSECRHGPKVPKRPAIQAFGDHPIFFRCGFYVNGAILRLTG
jgi:hypothetical protein